ncbi:MAG TPA: amidohydrolase family protein [Solirubrobacteraceae bacterium]|nr:amidohydrolase family protein [Solirubrobacteraceae bacterium]
MQALIDTHVHLIEPDEPGLGYGFATAPHPLFGGVVAPPDESPWTIERLAAEPSAPPVTGRVHVQCADAACDPVAETLLVDRRARSSGLIQALVVRVPLAEPACVETLERQLDASKLVRGVRDMHCASRLGEPAVDAALGAVASRSLSWDAHCTAIAQIDGVLALARRRPELQIVLTHAGLASARDEHDFTAWRAAIARLAGAPNVACKLSGLGIGDHDWTVESLRPWVLAAVEAFGPGRCMFGSNWPVDRLFSSYQALLDALAEILAGASRDERHAIFAGTARRVYRL